MGHEKYLHEVTKMCQGNPRIAKKYNISIQDTKGSIYLLQMSCSEEFQGISLFFYCYDNYETQELTKVFTCSVQINAALIAPFT